MQFGFSNPVVAILVALAVTVIVLLVYFPQEARAIFKRLDAKSTKQIQKESAAKLADMDRNIAERKARQGR